MPYQVDPPNTKESVRMVKSFLHNTIRNDWEFPLPPETEQQPDFPERRRIGWRMREYGPSDLSSDDEEARHAPAGTRTRRDPYKFDTPDAVGTRIADQRRKRQQQFHDEVQWNEGLRFWAKQRNAWTAAVGRKRPVKTAPRDVTMTDTHPDKRHSSDATEVSTSWSLPHQSPESSSIDSVESGGPETRLDAEVYLPIYPPLIPDTNPVRANIKPAAYAMIYSKVVVQSLTPSVPIPLTHMTSALVEGWKQEGNWPPSSNVLGQPPPPPIITLAHDSIKKSSQLLKLKEKSRVRKSIGFVKKAIGVKPNPLDELGIEFEEQDEEQDATLNRGLRDHEDK